MCSKNQAHHQYKWECEVQGHDHQVLIHKDTTQKYILSMNKS